MSDIEEQIQKLREHVPEDKSDDDIRRLIEEAGGDEVRLNSSQYWSLIYFVLLWIEP